MERSTPCFKPVQMYIVLRFRLHDIHAQAREDKLWRHGKFVDPWLLMPHCPDLRPWLHGHCKLMCIHTSGLSLIVQLGQKLSTTP